MNFKHQATGLFLAALVLFATGCVNIPTVRTTTYTVSMVPLELMAGDIPSDMLDRVKHLKSDEVHQKAAGQTEHIFYSGKKLKTGENENAAMTEAERIVVVTSNPLGFTLPRGVVVQSLRSLQIVDVKQFGCQFVDSGAGCRTQEYVFCGMWGKEKTDWCSDRVLKATGRRGGSGPLETQHKSQCPLICLQSEQNQGVCVGGCGLPVSATQPVINVDGANVETGFWVRGSGPGGRHGDDLRFDIIVRHLLPQGLLECSFAIDGADLGERTHVCQEPFGSVQITVFPGK